VQAPPPLTPELHEIEPKTLLQGEGELYIAAYIALDERFIAKNDDPVLGACGKRKVLDGRLRHGGERKKFD